jgi:N-acetylglucosaminyldiphosphoundecaprenol N-acetyl-beta-D-mannosaminyltransferase
MAALDVTGAGTGTRMSGVGVAARELFGLRVAATTMAEALALVDAAIARRERLMIGVVNAAKIVNMRGDPELRGSLVSSDVVFADGFSVVLAARLLGRRLPERVAGIDLMLGILERGDARGYRVYCLGAEPDVLDATTAAIGRSYPGVRIAGHHHGYFDEAGEAAVADDIRRSGADVLFVAMTSPKKERFLATWGPRLGVPVCHGVGGSFDVLAGKVQRAPIAWQRLGFEWLYRVKQERQRLWKRYLVTNSIFIGLLMLELGRTAPRRLAGAVRLRPAP